jgi:hypothetical protein
MISVKTLKLTLPGAPPGWRAESYMNSKDPLLNEWRIVVNQSIKQADAWFVCENLELDSESCQVPPDMIFVGSSETLYEPDWIISSPGLSAFYSQFHLAYTFNFFTPKKTVPSIPFLPWMLYANHGPSIFQQPTFIDILDSRLNLGLKSNRIALVCSNQSLTPGHRLRKTFANELKNHFGKHIDWFGNGINQFATKQDLYAKYKYSIVLENQSRDYVITEKIGDAFLGFTYPFYWGAPNIDHYFDSKGFEVIDILNFDSTIEKIEEALTANLFESQLDHIMENRRKVLFDHNFLHRIIKIADENLLSSSSEPTPITLESIKRFSDRFGNSSKALSGKVYSRLRKIDDRFQINSAPFMRELQVIIMHNPITRAWKKR